MTSRRRILAAVGLALALGCRSEAPPDRPAEAPAPPRDALAVMDAVAERYVKLGLALGRYDPPYVDAYYGPEAWRTEVQETKPTRDDIATGAAALLVELDAHPPRPDEDDLLVRRHRFLRGQVASLLARIEIIQGRALGFDEESRALYDAVAPRHEPEDFEAILAELDPLLPGSGSLVARFGTYKMRFAIPEDRLDEVFRAAIDACRARTLEHITLPAGESFDLEYVSGMPWAAYNRYQGGFHSLIQVNTGQPVFIDRAIDLACHEGYPGHHAYNVLLEERLVRERGWHEFSFYALFSPQSLISEGTANLGIDVAFPGAERLAFEREVLFPMAGLDPGEAARYYQVQGLIERLGYANVEGARRFLDNEIDVLGLYNWLRDYALMPRPRPALEFIKEYRSYVINYVLGEDLVRAHLAGQGATADDPVALWREFGRLLSTPRLPSELGAP